MPLPTNDPVAFRGVPSLGGNKKMAITVTFTQKQVEAMFQRHDALRAQGSSQCPLEIDFDDNKIHIGDIVTPFSRIKEVGTREICQRSPTVSKPLAGIMLAGNVIGKLNIQRDYDQVAGNIRKLTEAEVSKRKERHIVRLDSPPIIPKVTKSRPGSGVSSLAKKAMANRIVSAQFPAGRGSIPSPSNSHPAATKTSSASSRPTPPSSPARPAPPKSSTRHPVSGSSASPSNASPPTSSSLDLTSLRSHMIHYLAFDPRTTQDILLRMKEYNCGSESMREIEETLTVVAEEVRRPKNSKPGPVLWQLTPLVWKEIRPYEYGTLNDADRTKLARKGRLAISSFVDSNDPLWNHFRAAVDLSATSSVTKGKSKEKSTPPGPLVKTSEFKGGIFSKERVSTTKGGGVASGGVTKKTAPTAKSKAKKEQEDELEVKARKVVAALDDPKSKRKTSANGSSTGPRASVNRSKLKEEEEESIPLSVKSRQSLTSKKDDTPPVSKSRKMQDEKSASKRKADMYEEDDSEIEEGELPTKPVKKRKISVDDPKTKAKPIERKGPHIDKDSGKDKVHAGGESTLPKSVKDGPATVRPSTTGSSSKAAGSLGSNASRLEKERERETLELERQEREKRRSSGKRARRATPSFSSDEDEEIEAKPTVPSRAMKQKPPTQISGTSRSAASTSKLARVPSPVLPKDRESLRRRYHTCYAQYMGITSQFHQQRAKIEEALEADGDSVSADDVEMMDTEQLMQLCGEHDRLKDELERIQRAHSMAF